MKKTIPVVLAAVLAFGGAVPALANPAHQRARCFSDSAVCESVVPQIRSLHAKIASLVAEASAAVTAAASERAASTSVTTESSSGRAVAPQSVQTPSYDRSYGGCGYYVDADGDGICDYHGSGCYGSNRSSGGYGRHHGSGHHGGWCY